MQEFYDIKICNFAFCSESMKQGKTMNKIKAGMIRWLYLTVCCVCLLQARTVSVQAASYSLAEIREEFETAIRQGQTAISFTTSDQYTPEQIQQQLSKAALEQKRLYTGKSRYRRQADGGTATYTFWITQDSLLEVEPVKDTKEAYRKALTALRDCDYTTRFYSDPSCYAIFYLMLQQHPEYNYNTVVWKNKNGTYGYRRSSELTEAEQDAKMRAADRKAEEFVKSRLNTGMTTAQKLQAIHDYLVGRCSYDQGLKEGNGYEDSYTAYGALVKKKAVCQGYTGAFNLIAQKAGIASIAVCGKAGGENHSWNFVKAGRSGVYIDCTWDDTLQRGNGICYDYFYVSKSVIARDHVWERKKYTLKHLDYCKYLM